MTLTTESNESEVLTEGIVQFMSIAYYLGFYDARRQTVTNE